MQLLQKKKKEYMHFHVITNILIPLDQLFTYTLPITIPSNNVSFICNPGHIQGRLYPIFSHGEIISHYPGNPPKSLIGNLLTINQTAPHHLRASLLSADLSPTTVYNHFHDRCLTSNRTKPVIQGQIPSQPVTPTLWFLPGIFISSLLNSCSSLFLFSAIFSILFKLGKRIVSLFFQLAVSM